MFRVTAFTVSIHAKAQVTMKELVTWVPPIDLHMFMHCYELEINVLFGFNKMADEMGSSHNGGLTEKKAQQENEI